MKETWRPMQAASQRSFVMIIKRASAVKETCATMLTLGLKEQVGLHILFGLELLNALTSEKWQIYKLTAWHPVPRCELVDLLFLEKVVKMCANI